MKNLRIKNAPQVITSHLGFEFVSKDQPFDFCVRVLGISTGPLVFLESPKTTTVQIKAESGRENEIKELFEAIEIQESDLELSVSIPYIDKNGLILKLEALTGKERPDFVEGELVSKERRSKPITIESRPTFTEVGENIPEIGAETLELMTRLHHEFKQSMSPDEFKRYSMNVAKEADNTKSNARSLDEHFIIISEALNRAKRSILETVVAIKNAHDDLGKTMFQGELAFRLGMHRTTLNRWLSIAESSSIRLFQNQVPNTFSGLYGVSQIERTIHEISHNEEDAISTIVSLFEEEKIRPNSEQKELTQLNNSLKGGIPIEKEKLVLPEKVRKLDAEIQNRESGFNKELMNAIRPVIQVFLQEHFEGAFSSDHRNLSSEDVVGLAAKASTSNTLFWNCVGLCFAELANGINSGELPENLEFNSNVSKVMKSQLLSTSATKEMAKEFGWG